MDFSGVCATEKQSTLAVIRSQDEETFPFERDPGHVADHVVILSNQDNRLIPVSRNKDLRVMHLSPFLNRIERETPSK
jgi:hypothetical protein